MQATPTAHLIQALNVLEVEMKIGILITVVVISLLTAHILFSTQHYAKSQMPSVCDFLNDKSDVMPRGINRTVFI